MKFLDYFPGYYLQTFDDKGIDKSLAQHGKELDLRGLNARGAGIFFTPNRFTASRKAEFCEGVNAWFFEIDNISLDEQWEKVCNAPLMPSLVVKAKKSLHCYYLAKDGVMKNFSRIQNGLIKHFDSDPACKDISRVLRIPGYYHNKGEPHMVELIWEDGQSYCERDMFKAFPFLSNFSEGFWDSVSRFDNREILKRISGSKVGNFDSITFRKRSENTEYIDVNGQPADAWLDENGMIGSGSGGGPTFVQWLTWYGWSKGEIAKWVKEYCSDLLTRVEVPGVSVEKADMEKFLKGKYDLTWGVDSLDNTFSPLGRGKYVVLVGETGVGKTAFAFHVAKKNALLGHKVLYLSLEMSKEALLSRYAVSKMGISKYDFRDKKYNKDIFLEIINSLPRELHFIDSSMVSDITVDTIFKLSNGYDMVFVDNFGFIDSKGDTENEKIKNLSRAMVRLKNETGITVVALHHFRKGGEQTKRMRNLDAILGSGKIAHDVDFAIQVFRDMDLDEDALEVTKSELSVSMMKDRDFGDVCFSKVYFKNGEFT